MLATILDREQALKSPGIEELGRLYRQAAEKNGFPLLDRESRQILSRIGASMFFRDLRKINDDALSGERKREIVAESLEIIRQAAAEPVKAATQEAYLSSQENLRNAGIPEQPPEDARLRNAPSALQDAYGAALADFRTTIYELPAADGANEAELREDAIEALSAAAAIARLAESIAAGQ